jgi:Fe-Mn family superoxide dismutase
MKEKVYLLPELPYPINSLEPVISKEQLSIHHDKHHKAYVEKANELLKVLDDQRIDGDNIDVGAVAKKLSFNIAGDILHTLFWHNLSSPANKKEIFGRLKNDLETEFGSIERFRSEFYECATTIEGSGWAVLTYCVITGRPLIMQVQNHNLNLIPSYPVILVLDMWEHAYYLDYKNDKKTYANNFWQIVDWDEVVKRYSKFED